MTPERAEEIRKAGAQWANWSKHCTEEEDKYVRKVWDCMPGYTCWYDALCKIAKNKVDGKLALYIGCIRGVITDEDEDGKLGILLENGNYVWAEKDSVTVLDLLGGQNV